MMSYAISVIELSDDDYLDGVIPKRHPIFDVIKLIGLRLQSNYLSNLLYTDKRLPDIDPWRVFFKFSEKVNDGKEVYDFLEKIEQDFIVDLAKDLVLPWPWSFKRQIMSIARIGTGRSWGEWDEDNLNHNLELWLPMRIGFVRGGNHSISSGVLQGEGKLSAKSVYDVSKLYDYIYTDGAYFYRKIDNSIISETLSVEFAVIFEVGRIISEKGIK